MKKYEIRHEVGIRATPAAVYQALTNVKTLSKWWTSDTRGTSKVGRHLEFWFDQHLKEFKVIELSRNKRVRWKALDGDGIEWGTGEIGFELTSAGGQTHVSFTHSGWKSTRGALGHCTTKWGVFMLSLKDLLEKGKGRPYPRDVQINHL